MFAHAGNGFHAMHGLEVIGAMVAVTILVAGVAILGRRFK